MKTFTKKIFTFITLMSLVLGNLFAFSKDDLLNNNWVLRTGGYYEDKIKFLDDGTFTFTEFLDKWYGENPINCVGKYTLVDDVLTIFFDESMKTSYDNYSFQKLYKSKASCGQFQFILDEQTKDFEWRYYCISGDYILRTEKHQDYDTDCYLGTSGKGHVIKHNGKVYAKENVRFRYQPNLNCDIGRYYYKDYLEKFLKDNNLTDSYKYDYNGYLEVMLAGSVFDYICYTVDEETIDGVTDHWYLIRTSRGNFWVFGGYLSEYSDNDAENCKNMLIQSALSKNLLIKKSIYNYDVVIKNINNYTNAQIIIAAKQQLEKRGSIYAETSFMYQAYINNRYDLFPLLKSINYSDEYYDSSYKHKVNLYKKIIDDNNVEACKKLYEAGYKKFSVWCNEFCTWKVSIYSLEHGNRELLNYLKSIGVDYKTRSEYLGESKDFESLSLYYFAINNPDAIKFLYDNKLNINEECTIGSFEYSYSFTILDYAIEHNLPTADLIKKLGGKCIKNK